MKVTIDFEPQEVDVLLGSALALKQSIREIIADIRQITAGLTMAIENLAPEDEDDANT